MKVNGWKRWDLGWSDDDPTNLKDNRADAPTSAFTGYCDAVWRWALFCQPGGWLYVSEDEELVHGGMAAADMLLEARAKRGGKLPNTGMNDFCKDTFGRMVGTGPWIRLLEYMNAGMPTLSQNERNTKRFEWLVWGMAIRCGVDNVAEGYEDLPDRLYEKLGGAMTGQEWHNLSCIFLPRYGSEKKYLAILDELRQPPEIADEPLWT